MGTMKSGCPGTMRPVFLAAAVFLLLAWPFERAFATSKPDAGVFLSQLADRAIVELTEPGIAEAEKERRFRVLVADGFDIPAIGRFVVGKYWRRADQAAAALAADHGQTHRGVALDHMESAGCFRPNLSQPYMGRQ